MLWIFSVSALPVRYTPPSCRSKCHYIVNHYEKAGHVRLGEANNMRPLSWGAPAEKIRCFLQVCFQVFSGFSSKLGSLLPPPPGQVDGHITFTTPRRMCYFFYKVLQSNTFIYNYIKSSYFLFYIFLYSCLCVIFEHFL